MEREMGSDVEELGGESIRMADSEDNSIEAVLGESQQFIVSSRDMSMISASGASSQNIQSS